MEQWNGCKDFSNEDSLLLCSWLMNDKHLFFGEFSVNLHWKWILKWEHLRATPFPYSFIWMGTLLWELPLNNTNLTSHVCHSVLTLIAHSFARTKINNNRVDPLPFWSFVSDTIGVHCFAFSANHWSCQMRNKVEYSNMYSPSLNNRSNPSRSAILRIPEYTVQYLLHHLVLPR